MIPSLRDCFWGKIDVAQAEAHGCEQNKAEISNAVQADTF